MSKHNIIKVQRRYCNKSIYKKHYLTTAKKFKFVPLVTCIKTLKAGMSVNMEITAQLNGLHEFKAE
jgi:hypothetical protein